MSQQIVKKPFEKKKYTQLRGQDCLPEDQNGETIGLPTLWIDSKDLLTIKEYCRFWLYHLYDMEIQFKKLTKSKRQDYLNMLRKCAQTCPQEEYHSEYHILTFALERLEKINSHIYLSQREKFKRQLHINNKEKIEIETTQPNLQSQDAVYSKSQTMQQDRKLSKGELFLKKIKNRLSGIFLYFSKSQSKDLRQKMLDDEDFDV